MWPGAAILAWAMVVIVGWAMIPLSAVTWASAWNQPAGLGLLIADVTFSGGTHYFNGLGRIAPAALYEKHEFATYIEYGLTDALMLVVRPVFMTVDTAAVVGAPAVAHYAGPGTSEAGIQLQLPSFGPAVFALASSLALPATLSQRNPALVGNTSRDLDMRLLMGLPLRIGGWEAFADVQGAWRLRSNGAPGEWHADLTFGLRPRPGLSIQLQSFNTLAVGPGTAWFPASSSSKLAASVVIDLDRALAVQFGVYTTLVGRETLRETGFEAGFWHRF